MIIGRIPEITIKFTEKPPLPTEGKKVTLEIQAENNVTVACRSQPQNPEKTGGVRWMNMKIGLVRNRGKIIRVSADGVISVEAAGVNVFEKKKKEPLPAQQATTA